MADIKPFKAVLYNQDKVADLSKVTCPPYDVIDAQAKAYFYESSVYNFARLILPGVADNTGSGLDADESALNKYAHAKKQMQHWLNSQILMHDGQEAVYFYEQEYVYPANKRNASGVYLGEKKIRRGFISLLKIEDPLLSDQAPGKGRSRGIFAHEHTHLGPKEDRLSLLRQVKANLSSIFVLFDDKDRIIRRIWNKYGLMPPVINITCDSIKHKVWRITDEMMISQLIKSLKNKDVFIADGHHRYEVACNFRQEMHSRLNNSEVSLDCDYVMTYFTDLNSSGLTILPTHRVIKNMESGVYSGLSSEIEKYFDVYKAKDKADLFIMLGRSGKSEHVLGMYKYDSYAKENKFFLLRLKRNINIDKVIDIDKPKEYKKLAVVILDELVLGKILKISPSNNNISDNTAAAIHNKESLFYTDDADLAVKMVDEETAKVAFFLNPVCVQEMARLALQGEKMPPKSTFFYPKLLSGLTIYKFNDDNG